MYNFGDSPLEEVGHKCLSHGTTQKNSTVDITCFLSRTYINQIAVSFICNFTSSGIVQGHSIGINLKHTQHIEAKSLTTLTHVVGGADVEEADTSKY